MSDATTGIIDTLESRMRIGGMEDLPSNVRLDALRFGRIGSSLSCESCGLQPSSFGAWITVYFPVKWAHRLAETIPGAKPPVELKGARIFFPEERADQADRPLERRF